MVSFDSDSALEIVTSGKRSSFNLSQGIHDFELASACPKKIKGQKMKIRMKIVVVILMFIGLIIVIKSRRRPNVTL